jgi:hypothetical protein
MGNRIHIKFSTSEERPTVDSVTVTIALEELVRLWFMTKHSTNSPS